MPTLPILVDYDNLDRAITRAGPVALARTLTPLVPAGVLADHDSINVRLYGGWRTQGSPTVVAQQLIPRIRADCPTVFPMRTPQGEHKHLRLNVELADGPIGSRILLQETLARNRGLRRFRARPLTPGECTRPLNCGLTAFHQVSHQTECQSPGCSVRLSELLVRDEQKMVDTLLVADIAELTLVQRSPTVVLVSSDMDMWPAVLLAIRIGSNVIHIHTTAGRRTQTHLLRTLSSSFPGQYQQFSV